MLKGKVLSVNISDVKGVIKHPVSSVTLKEDFGIIGDSHAGPGIRQVSLLAMESIKKFEAERGKIDGVLEGKFAENITTEGLVLYELPVGTQMKIGETLLEVSQIGKKCHADQGCEIAKRFGICCMPKEGIFVIVLKGGIIKPGDMIEVL